MRNREPPVPARGAQVAGRPVRHDRRDRVPRRCGGDPHPRSRRHTEARDEFVAKVTGDPENSKSGPRTRRHEV
jgi:hypothetical protein